MKLFYATGSSSLFPHIVLYESGLNFEAVKIDEHTKEITGGGDYRSVNPLGTVPALVLDDDTLIVEGPVIAQYIADLVPEKKLAPPNGTDPAAIMAEFPVKRHAQGWLLATVLQGSA